MSSRTKRSPASFRSFRPQAKGCVFLCRQSHREDWVFARLARHRHVTAHHGTSLARDTEARSGAKPRAAGRIRGVAARAVAGTGNFTDVGNGLTIGLVAPKGADKTEDTQMRSL